jgi:DNA modification methylase
MRKKKNEEAHASKGALKRIEVKITPAKGRPMLTWVGKKPLAHVTAFPAQPIETFDPAGMIPEKQTNSDLWKDWPSAYPKGGLLFHGDNKEVLAHLLANGFRGKVNLIYIDPPFDSGADYVRKVTLRGPKVTAKVDGEGYTLGEQIQYADIWANDNYLQFMYERLLLLKELLTEDGSVYLHCDWHKNHFLRCLMDEIFGGDNFKNEIIWYYPDKFATGGKALDKNHDLILHYSKGQQFTGNEVRIEKPETTRRALRKKIDGKTQDVLDEHGNKIIAEYSDKRIDDVWQTGRSISNNEYLGYPTQKKDLLTDRIIEYGSNLGDLILDCFIGSGTTAAVAQKSGRRWICCDINNGAIQTTAKRLQNIILDQIKDAKKAKSKSIEQKLIEIDDEEKASPINPAQLAFTVWRVNDYDLSIQHNEAVNLACEHIGIQRTRSAVYFEGTLGKSLVKIIPFAHPLTPLDLEELKKELDARPDEERHITVVCLGMELAAKAWVEDWNRLRKGKNAVNRIEVIELRTDQKYGKFIKHEPARAKVKIECKKDKIIVEIEDFISPSIIERLSHQAGILKPKIDDWRAMVDCVMIDTAYDGQVFNIILSDVPEKKTDFVEGKYELPASGTETTVAVKIIDMLGEEVLITQNC